MRQGRDTGPAARAAVALFATLVGLTACGEKAAPAPITVERGTWSAIRTEIIDKTCAFASCHGGNRPAAGLDLSVPSACRNLVDHPSCLFPNQVLVKGGKPDESFLMHKLTGEGLSATPEVTCGTGSNFRMPFGAPALSARQLAIVNSWIATGADCEDGGGPGADGGTADGFGLVADGGMGGAEAGAETGLVVAVAAVTPPRLTVVAGQRGDLQVTLTRAAALGGTAVTVEIADGTLVGVPATVVVPAGQTAVTVAVIGKRPGSTRVRVTADIIPAGAGTAAVGADVIVTGLRLHEILVAGTDAGAGSSWIELANVSEAPIDLSQYRVGLGVNAFVGATSLLDGILAPGGCFVVGGPQSGPGNGSPTYAQVWNLSAVFFGSVRMAPQSFVVGLFDGVTDLSTGLTLPIDAVAFAGAGDTGLLNAEGQALTPVAPLPAGGHSLRRAGASSWREEAAPSPGVCQPLP